LIQRLVVENLKHRPVRTLLSAIAIGVQVTAHQALGHDLSFAAMGHIEAIGHFAGPFDIRGSGTDWHLV
jgi:hypothetical protein